MSTQTAAAHTAMIRSAVAHRDALNAARKSLAKATETARLKAINLHANGIPETVIARTLGVNRTTVRKWLDK